MFAVQQCQPREIDRELTQHAIGDRTFGEVAANVTIAEFFGRLDFHDHPAV